MGCFSRLSCFSIYLFFFFFSLLFFFNFFLLRIYTAFSRFLLNPFFFLLFFTFYFYFYPFHDHFVNVYFFFCS
ncbi:hypothetical protein DFH27DRAFT_562001 [Peziza echinospora]|nr:hypothetical protein DFH27DRAFT_562001 [Peziza echinospora]